MHKKIKKYSHLAGQDRGVACQKARAPAAAALDGKTKQLKFFGCQRFV